MTKYIAVDGTKFLTKQECINYENSYLKEKVTLINRDGRPFLFPHDTDSLFNVAEIIFHDTSFEFVSNFLHDFGGTKIQNNISEEELTFLNEDKQIVLIYSGLYNKWINPYYRIKHILKNLFI